MQGKHKRSHVGELYKQFGTLPIPDSHELQIASFVHRVLHHPNEISTIFRDYFVMNEDLHAYNTSRKDSIHVVEIKTNYGQRLIRSKGPVI